MTALSHRLDPAAGGGSEAADDRASLACACGVSMTGLALGLTAALGPAGSDDSVATALVAVLGGAGLIGLGFGLAAALFR